jgi:hypothetical protein
VGYDGFGALLTVSADYVICVSVTILRDMTMDVAQGWRGGGRSVITIRRNDQTKRMMDGLRRKLVLLVSRVMQGETVCSGT